MKQGFIPEGKERWYTCRHEVILKPGHTLTLTPTTPHWFQAGEAGAVLICFCSTAVDAKDPFTDPAVIRLTKVVKD
jgi:D-lyxose ketol-isomerase